MPLVEIGSAEWMKELVARTDRLLGSSLVRLRARQARKRVPRADIHPLISLVEAARRCSLRLGLAGVPTPDEDLVAVAELAALVEVSERWQHHSVWPVLRREMKDPGGFRHAFLQLGIASHYADAGNRVGLVSPAKDSRSADLWVAPPAVTPRSHRLGVEVKAPASLDCPLSPIRSEQADRIVGNAFRKLRGQLPSGHPGLLVIGGFNLRDEDLTVLEEACRRHFQRIESEHRYLTGVAIYFARPQLVSVPVRAFGGQRVDRLDAPTRAHLIRNPAYEGSIQLVH